MRKLTIFALFLPLALVGCLSEVESPQAVVVTATPDVLATVANQPMSPVPVLNMPDNSPLPTVPVNCTPQEGLPTITRYRADATLDWTAHTVEVVQDIMYINTTGGVLENMVLLIEGNRDAFTINAVTMDESDVPGVRTEDSRITIPLPAPLLLNCPLELTVSYSLRLSPVEEGYFGRFGYLGYTPRQVNLGHWMPTVAVRKPDWDTPRSHFIGEFIYADASDFDVTLQVENAPETIHVVGPGVAERVGDATWHYELSLARNIALSVSDGMTSVSQEAENGVQVEVHYFPATQPANLDTASHALQVSIDSMLLFERLYGVPYPYSRLVVVEGDFLDGMEFSGLVFVGEAWFRTWDGRPNSWLTIITTHEVAHQWWHTIVGNDPAINPYLDEAFATYSEYLYYENFEAAQTDWWWQFRVQAYSAEGAVDSDVYRYDNGRNYINAVYLRGAEMLHALRGDLGDDAFFAWLRTYAENYQFEIATSESFWEQLPADQYEASTAIREAYLENATVLPE